jgi:large subunit ribosomal protein L3
MAGHMGDISVSVKNLEVVGLDKVKNLLVIKGGVPGPTGTLVTVTKLGRIKGYTPPPEEKEEEEQVESSNKNQELIEQTEAQKREQVENKEEVKTDAKS